MRDLLAYLPSIVTDACIIEEQTDHLVIAFRIPKRTLTENMPFLAAIADRTGTIDVLPPTVQDVVKAIPRAIKTNVLARFYRRFAGSRM